MRVLMVSTDQKIFESTSEVRSRMLDYAILADELWVLILGGQRQKSERIGNLYLLAKSRWQALFWRPPVRFDLVTSQDPFENGFIAWCLAKHLDAKLQFQIHTDFSSPYFWRESWKNKIRVLLAKFLLPKADGIRVVSERTKKSLVSSFKIHASRIIILPIFVDIEKLRAAPIKTDLHQKYPQFEKIILMASRLTKEKNIGLAIEAMGKVVENYPHTGLIIVGSGPEERCLKLKTKTYNLEPNVVFEPWTGDLTSYYKTADLFLLTSNYEGYGRTIVEALACGLPVVSTDVGVAREVGAVVVAVAEVGVLADVVLASMSGDQRGILRLNLGTKADYLSAYAQSLHL